MKKISLLFINGVDANVGRPVLTEACQDIDLLNLIATFRIIITIFWIGISVALVIWIMVDIMKVIASGEVDTKKMFSNMSQRILALVLVFLVPAIIHIVMSIAGAQGVRYLDCYQTATRSGINELARDLAEYELANFPDNPNYNNFQETLAAINRVPAGREQMRFKNELWGKACRGLDTDHPLRDSCTRLHREICDSDYFNC